MREDTRILYRKAAIAYEEIQRKRRQNEEKKNEEDGYIVKRNGMKQEKDNQEEDVGLQEDEETRLLDLSEREKKYIVAVFRNK